MKLVGNRNQCQGCKEYFNSNSAFDMHRIGEPGHGRRCRTTDEMRLIGMLKNKAGFWIKKSYSGYHKRSDEDE